MKSIYEIFYCLHNEIDIRKNYFQNCSFDFGFESLQCKHFWAPTLSNELMAFERKYNEIHWPSIDHIPSRVVVENWKLLCPNVCPLFTNNIAAWIAVVRFKFRLLQFLFVRLLDTNEILWELNNLIFHDKMKCFSFAYLTSIASKL